jgi:PAS domain S-box-containing protein
MNTTSQSNTIIETAAEHGYPEKSITETIVNGFFTVDRHWTVRYWNNAAEKILKVKAKDIVGKNLWEEFAGTIPVEFYAVYHKAFLQDIPVHFEEYWGEMESWFEVIAYYCDDTLSVSFKNSNLSVHPGHPKHPVRQLQIINELYKFVTEVTNDCLWEWDFRARELFWIDGGHKRAFGYQVENALIPQTFWENCIHPDDKIRVVTRLNEMIANGSGHVWEDEYRFKKANNEYAYVHDRGHIIYDVHKKPARMIGATQDISARKLAEIQVLESERKLVQQTLAKQREITQAVLTAQENERAHVGKELHDNLNQILAATKIYIKLAENPGIKQGKYLEKASGYINDVIAEIRKISKKLETTDIQIIGLFDSIDILLNDTSLIHPVKIEFHKNDLVEEDLSQKLQLDIFRIVQEQLNNILQHADATRAAINLTRLENEVVLLISDNGKGCDLSKDKNAGVGIINIRGRVELYHGRITVASSPGNGYELKVVLPLH